MSRRTTRPRSNSERGRAGRARIKLAAGTLGKRDTAWLGRYDRDVGKAKEARAAAPPLPRAARARSNTERGKASRLRARGRTEPLSAKDARWLQRYRSAVFKAKRIRSVRAARQRSRSPAEDAGALATAIAEWLGQDSVLQETEAGSLSGGAAVEARLGEPADLEEQPLSGVPDLAPHLTGGHAMTVRVELLVSESKRAPGGSRWATILAYTDDPDVAGLDLAVALQEAYDAYRAQGVAAVAVLVGAG